ncbi:choline/ethanolamine kinase isoform X2 [Daktulosphaira vitifoliae]|uniref:choline/ethanolamine kinase isoform X2 n=1 Tax=Daktulosphaira vitifoliae TaxID=58002 RepID=UPI0021A9B15B|nr:choline/ethanolamine kinase isoform X2 [Daktulosphaira vitifoliae]
MKFSFSCATVPLSSKQTFSSTFFFDKIMRVHVDTMIPFYSYYHSVGLAQCNDMFEMAARLCRGYLPGSWKKVTVKDIAVKRISGGLSNWLYRITLLKGNSEPRDVLMRLYGQTHGESAIENIITESVIFTLLSERGLGPRLHGIFPGGRLEEYIPARSLKSDELSDQKLSLMIAEKMADLHQLNIPINKDSTWLWDTMDRWLQQPISDCNLSRDNIELDQILSINLSDETRWLKKHLTKLRSPVVFCHNDLQEGNVLLKEKELTGSRSLCLIDYEYCAYNYRGFDIANHFIEWIYDYTNPKYPHYTVKRDLFPTKDQQVEFLKRYLQCMGSDEPIEVILNEVRHFTLASHLFWGIWSIVNSRTSKITFGYREYAVERLKTYFKLKENLKNTI